MKIIKTALALITALSFSACQTGFQPIVENGVVLGEYGHFGTAYPSYVIMYDEDETYGLSAVVYVTEMGPEGLPLSLENSAYYREGEVWEFAYKETWAYTFDGRRIQEADYGDPMRMATQWAGETLEKSYFYYTDELFDTISYNYTDQELQSYTSTWLDDQGNTQTYSVNLIWEDGLVKGFTNQEGYEEIIEYDDRGRVIKAATEGQIHFYFYDAWEENRSFLALIQEHLPPSMD
jgi:hypothetical protein